jgi:uncharacterized protein
MRKLLMLLLVSGVVTSCRTQTKLPPLEKAKNNNTVLWEVTGKNTKNPFYILGTMHLMCREDAQLSKNLKEVLKRTDIIYFELDMDDVMGMMSGMSAMRMKNGVKLKDLVTPEEYTRIKNYFNKNGMLPFNMVENFKPMLLASTVTEDQMSCKTQSGVEMMMMEENDGKKEILGLETMADQAGIFDSIPYKDQVKELLKMLDSVGTGSTGEGIKELVDAYKKQDLKKIEAITLESEPGLKDYMDLLLYKRNRNWITTIKQVTGNKTIIFAVGAGHLVGKVGVLELLKKEGYSLRPLKN